MNKEKIKPSYDTDRQILGKVFPLDTPFNVILDTSEVCNFRCNYCFRFSSNKEHWGYAKDNGIMQWAIFTNAVEQIKEFPQQVKQISLSNHGEPLVNRKLPDMVRYIKKQKISSRVSIHTNASLLNEEYINDLVDSEIDRIVVSLQGLDEGSYQKMCGIKIDYNNFYNNLKLLYTIKKNTQIHIKIANTALYKNEENKFYEMYSSIADRVFIEQVVPIWKNMYNKITIPMIQNKYGESFPKQECCPLIFHTIVVVPNGDVYPCTQILTKEKLGNIQKEKLVNLWNSKKRIDLLLRQVEFNQNDVCKDCYILQNSIYSKEDMIDMYSDEIRERLIQKLNLN